MIGGMGTLTPSTADLDALMVEAVRREAEERNR